MVIQIVLILLSSGLTYAAFPSFGLSGLAFICLFPFLYVLHRNYLLNQSSQTSWLHLFFPGFLYGVGYMGLTNLWIIELLEFSTPLKLILLWWVYTGFESLFFGLITLFMCKRRSHLLAFPGWWVIMEWIRSSGDFGSANGLLGYSQASNILVNTLASFGGVLSVSLYCVLINVLLVLIIHSRQTGQYKDLKRYSVGFILLLVGMYSYHPRSLTPLKPVSMAAIQVNHPIAYKFKKSSKAAIRKEYIDLSKSVINESHPDIIIWPETITSSFNLEYPYFVHALRSLSQTESTSFLFGTPRREGDHVYNSAVFISDDQLITYDKLSLMPFGEYWPAQSLFTFFGLSNIIPGSDFSRGQRPTIFASQELTYGTAICLETTQPYRYRHYAKEGVDILVSLVNNAWFKTSSIAARQLQMLQFRCIETGRPAIQAANMGMTALIDANGRILKHLPPYQTTTLFWENTLSTRSTFYTQFGDDTVLSIASLLILLGFFKRR